MSQGVRAVWWWLRSIESEVEMIGYGGYRSSFLQAILDVPDGVLRVVTCQVEEGGESMDEAVVWVLGRIQRWGGRRLSLAACLN